MKLRLFTLKKGKTLAFLLPALVHIDNQITPREKRVGPNVLVMCPTRELAIQIDHEVKKINYKGIKSVVGLLIFFRIYYQWWNFYKFDVNLRNFM